MDSEEQRKQIIDMLERFMSRLEDEFDKLITEIEGLDDI